MVAIAPKPCGQRVHRRCVHSPFRDYHSELGSRWVEEFVSQPFSGPAHLDIEERNHIAGYAEIHGNILPGDQALARRCKYFGVVSMLKKIDWCAMRALHEIQ